MALKKRAQGNFNVASDEPINFAQIAKVLKKRLITLPEIILNIQSWVFQLGLTNVDPVWAVCFKGQGIRVSSEKIRNEMGWEPTYKTTSDVVCYISRDTNPGIEFFFSGLMRLFKFQNLFGINLIVKEFPF